MKNLCGGTCDTRSLLMIIFICGKITGALIVKQYYRNFLKIVSSAKLMRNLSCLNSILAKFKSVYYALIPGLIEFFVMVLY